MECKCFMFMLLHSLVLIYLITFPLLFPQLDVFYLITVSIVTLHWVFLENECIISFFEKKCFDSSYTLGGDSRSVFYDFFFFRKKYLFSFLYFCSLIIVLLRNTHNLLLTTLSLLIFTFMSVSTLLPFFDT